MFGGRTLLATSLLAPLLNASKQLDFSRYLVQRRVLRKLAHQVDDHFAVAHAGDHRRENDITQTPYLFARPVQRLSSTFYPGARVGPFS